MIRLNLRFLFQQTLAFLLLTHFALIGGSQSGVLFYSLRRLSVILLVPAVVAWGVFWARRKFPFASTRLDLLWLGFIVSQCLAAVLSTDPRRTVVPLTLTVGYWLVFHLLVDLLRQSKNYRLLAGAFVLLGLVLVAFGVLELATWYRGWFTIGGWGNLVPPSTVRLRSLVAHPNFLAAYLNLLLPFGMVALLKTNRRVVAAGLGCWSLAVLALIFLTSSRGGWFGTAAGLLTLALLWLSNRWRDVIVRWQRVRRQPVFLGAAGLLLVALILAAGYLLNWQAQHTVHAPLFSSRQGLWEPVWMTLSRFPLWGSGPATYATQALQIVSSLPLYSHAHSFPLHILMESGLLGTLALICFAVAVVYSVWKHWISTTGPARVWLAAAVAALVSTAVHSQFDTPQVVPGFCFLVVLILALVESFSFSSPCSQQLNSAIRGLFALAWAVMLFMLPLGLADYARYTRGIALANWNRYADAVSVLDAAAEHDSSLATNWFQAGYVHAVLGRQNNDAVHLQTAISCYRRGVSLEPQLASNWANLGVLLWHVGDEAAARAALQQAVERAPREAAFPLTLGALEEAAGNLTCAADLYRQGLELRPVWAESFFFRATPLRASVREEWQAASAAPSEPLQPCWDALHAADLDGARRCFAAAPTLNDPTPYYGLGLTEQAAGNLAQAEWNLRTAAWMASLDPRVTAQLYFALGDVLAQQGELPEAVSWYERARTRVEPRGAFEYDMGGLTTDYTWFVFNREAIFDSYLPGVVWIAVTDDVAGRMLQLGEWYEQLGQVEDARRTYQALLQAVPDVDQARERLSVLGWEDGVP